LPEEIGGHPAVARADRRGRAGRFRVWFYDLVAGKPSLPPLGGGAKQPDHRDDSGN
jgi:hypothetical protein